MFLDPEPRNTRRPASQTEFQGFIPPLATPIDQRIIRKPLHDLSTNQQTRQAPEDEEPLKPTVRLIGTSPSVASLKQELFGDADNKVPQGRRKSHRLDLKTGKDVGLLVSGLQSPTVEFQDVDSSIDDSLQSATSEDLPPWKRRSVSSSNFSNATTLKASSESASAYARSDRLSSGTTYRESSTLHDTSLEDLPESAEEAGPLDDTDYSATTYEYEGSLAENQTIKTAPSVVSLDNHTPQVETPRPRSRRQTWSSSDSEPTGSSPPEKSTFTPTIPPRISSKHQSSASFSATKSLESTPEAQSSSPPAWTTTPVQSEVSDGNFQTSFTSSPNFDAFPSSPNFIAYESSPTRPRSRSHPLRGEASYESIGSRLQSQPTKRRSLAPSASWSSVDPASSLETLPSIHVPRRRLRQVRGSQSLDLDSQMQAHNSQMNYPRDTLSGNLSTIASESERSRSHTASRQLSHFSAGAGQDESSITLTGSWSKRFGSAVPADDEPGDMTLGLYREESALPEPLFRAPSPMSQPYRRRLDGELPPLPPIPHDEEGHDTLAELANPSLRLKRSGYSLRRQRSNNSLRHQLSNGSLRHQRSVSTPVHSRHVSMVSSNESESWSSGSIIFPLWVRHFYAGDIALASMSQISLYPAAPSPPSRDGALNGMRFDRYPSMRYQRSITGPPSTAASEAEARTPQSRRFVPAIFRPRHRSFRIKSRSERVSPMPETVRAASQNFPERDSMAIEPVLTDDTVTETHSPSSHLRYASVKDVADSPQPQLARKQRHWNEMSAPSRTSHDQLAEFTMPTPHLAPTKRSSAHLSTWRPPSFTESIDLILKSRGHRQILFFLFGFLCPLVWMVGACMPLPERPVGLFDPEKAHHGQPGAGIEHGEYATLWREEKAWRQGVWWRNVNRVMSILGLLVIGAIIAVAVVATR